MIVVGVDGSKEAEAALRWAIDEAKLRGTGVRVIHAWNMPAPPGRIGYYSTEFQDPSPFREGAERFVSESLAEVDAEAQGVQVDGEAVQGPPAEVLVNAGKGAELLVVGSRGQGGFRALLLGSVSEHCARHASCPVVIVREAPRSSPRRGQHER
jgi:nucleotide-binding universal stress UspA family protein